MVQNGGWGSGEQQASCLTSPLPGWLSLQRFEMFFCSIHISPVTHILSTLNWKSASSSSCFPWNSRSGPWRNRKHYKWGPSSWKSRASKRFAELPWHFPSKRSCGPVQSHLAVSQGLQRVFSRCWPFTNSGAALTSWWSEAIVVKRKSQLREGIDRKHTRWLDWIWAIQMG